MTSDLDILRSRDSASIWATSSSGNRTATVFTTDECITSSAERNTSVVLFHPEEIQSARVDSPVPGVYPRHQQTFRQRDECEKRNAENAEPYQGSPG
jgi:hypothetical protein